MPAVVAAGPAQDLFLLTNFRSIIMILTVLYQLKKYIICVEKSLIREFHNITDALRGALQTSNYYVVRIALLILTIGCRYIFHLVEASMCCSSAGTAY